MSVLSLGPLHRFRPWGPLVLRVVVGGLFAYHGYRGLTRHPGGEFADFLRSLSIPQPRVMAWVVVGFEFFAGLALLAGLLTRIVGLLVALEMAYTTLWVKLLTLQVGVVAPPAKGSGAEVDLLILAGALTLVLLGPGRPSLDARLGIEREPL